MKLRLLTTIVIAALLLVSTKKCSTYQPSIKITDNFIEINSLDTFYRTAGDPSNKTLVFTPGWASMNANGCNAGNDLVIEKLAQHFYVVMYEPPGLMRSEPPNNIWNFEEYATHLHLLLEKLEITEANIMGQSFGGGISTAYAKLYPNETRRLILVDSTMSDQSRNWYYNLKFPWNAFVKQVLSSKIAPFPLKRLLVNKYFGVPKDNVSRDNVQEWNVVADIQQQYQLKTNYSELMMPVIMIWGDKDTFVTPITRAQEISHTIQNSTFITVEGGHTVLFQKPDLAVQKIVDNIAN